MSCTVPGFESLYGGSATTFILHPALMTLVGPNGTGKTRMLRSLFQQAGNTLHPNLGEKKTRFLAAGRGSPFEPYRADIDGPGHRKGGMAAIGAYHLQDNWNMVESVTGDYLALDQQPDLLLKVEARLQQLFSRSLILRWSQNGLAISMAPTNGGSSYSAGNEASGILQLVALLAAIHNDQIGVLAIDEPEISLHPQHQAFLLGEMLSVAGDPVSDKTKKLIIIATHSPSMLSVRSALDIPKAIFFSHAARSPVQSALDAPELNARKIKALTARLGATHRMAFFANTALLVEGSSDEIITTQLTERIDHPLLSQNAQIVPVGGKGEFIEVAKLFRALGKRVVVMADLDALTDSNELVNFFSVTDEDNQVAGAMGHRSVSALDSQIRGSLAMFVLSHWVAIEPIASHHLYWSDCPEGERTEKTKSRAALACLLSDAQVYVTTGVPAAECQLLRNQVIALLDMLEKLGCYVLRKGTIENYFSRTPSGTGKPEAAAEEGASFAEQRITELEARYADVLRAISDAAPLRRVDESELLREKLGAALGAIMQSMTENSTAEQIAAKAESTIGLSAKIFAFENVSVAGNRRVKVSMRSPLFVNHAVSLEIGESDNPTTLLRSHFCV